MNYRKYTWIGNRVSDKDMQMLYCIRKETGKHITIMVAEAISEYLNRRPLQASQDQRRGVK